MHKPKLSDFNFDSSKISEYEIDLAAGKLSADGPDDHQRMLEALEKLTKAHAQVQPLRGVENSVLVQTSIPATGRITVSELATKFFTLKSSLTSGTKTDYLATAKEFDASSSVMNLTT